MEGGRTGQGMGYIQVGTGGGRGNVGEYVGWEEWWGHVGHVPREGIEGIEQFCEGGQGAGRVKELALATGKITMAYAEQAWT